MTIEAQLTDALLTGVDAQSAFTLAGTAADYFREDWKRLGYVPLVGFVLYGLLRSPHPPSIHPSTTTRVNARESSPADRRPPGRSDTAIRVSGQKEPAPKVWAVPGLVPQGPLPTRRLRLGVPPWEWERKGYITCILGSGGTGKSYVLLDLALAALGGAAWMGRAVRPVRAVLYVDTELDAEECRRRAFPLARGRGHPAPPAGLHYLFLRHSLASEEGQRVVGRLAKRLRADLILVDSMTIGSFDIAASDQNGWNRVYTGMERWGAPVVCIDHMDKAGKGAFGSFMKQAKVRSLLKLTRRADGSIRVDHEKSNFGPLADPFTVAAEFEAPSPHGPVTRFSPAPPAAPSVYQEPQTVDAAPRLAQVEPVVAQVTPLRLVPTPLGRDGVCGAIMACLEADPPAPMKQADLVRRIVQARACARPTAYLHLPHLLADGLLVEADGLLRVRNRGRDQITEEATA